MSCDRPTPDQIRASREAAGITQREAAGLVCVESRTWQRWESGDRGMPPGIWKLFRIEAGERGLE